MFWTITALITLLAALAVMRPFLRAQTHETRHGEHALEVYRDQLEELERDVQSGLISRDEAMEARAELGRRILQVDDEGTSAGTRLGKDRIARAVAIAAVLFVPVASWGIYGVLGSPEVPAQPLSARQDADPSQASIQELVARAEAQLAQRPDDVRGWQALAPIYARLGRFGDAANAYRRILALEGEDATIYALLGEALVGGAQGVVQAEAEKAFSAALELDPENPRARFYLALALAQEGREEEAGQRLQALSEDLPADSPWLAAARSAMAGLTPGGAQPEAGPLRANAEQQAMIESMVSGLDQRLRENPEDPEGWQRLLRSLSVLGRKEAAQDALDRAIAALGPDSKDAQSIRDYAETLPIFGEE
ncbi:Cytochrome c-type biogenesis protein [Nitratireductor basaltis]|uniref:Cytochrome c-type biogenesis protein n=2 Tax=Nitratireductor basaltis TaxID=472175 RepID=A0A084UCF0_9HYPH|nr:Cytochrome c-type biogenesis protein [Nitratireductor basaltis]